MEERYSDIDDVRRSIDTEIRRKLERACKVALRHSGVSVDENKVKECVRILEDFISRLDELYSVDAEAQLKKLGIREIHATKLVELAIKWSRGR